MRNGYLIHYVLNGMGIYKARGKIFRLREGDAFLICPHELIYYEADLHTPWTYTWIGMQGIKIKGYLERMIWSSISGTTTSCVSAMRKCPKPTG